MRTTAVTGSTKGRDNTGQQHVVGVSSYSLPAHWDATRRKTPDSLERNRRRACFPRGHTGGSGRSNRRVRNFKGRGVIGL